MSAARRLALALAWLAVLLLAGAWLGQRLQVSGDLRKFMPAPRTPAQTLLIEEMGEGPGSRLLLVALSGADPATLAKQSQALRARLAASPRFAMVENGGEGLEAIPARLRPYRYLLSDTLDHAPLDATHSFRLGLVADNCWLDGKDSAGRAGTVRCSNIGCHAGLDSGAAGTGLQRRRPCGLGRAGIGLRQRLELPTLGREHHLWYIEGADGEREPGLESARLS